MSQDDSHNESLKSSSTKNSQNQIKEIEHKNTTQYETYKNIYENIYLNENSKEKIPYDDFIKIVSQLKNILELDNNSTTIYDDDDDDDDDDEDDDTNTYTNPNSKDFTQNSNDCENSFLEYITETSSLMSEPELNNINKKIKQINSNSTPSVKIGKLTDTTEFEEYSNINEPTRPRLFEMKNFNTYGHNSDSASESEHTQTSISSVDSISTTLSKSTYTHTNTNTDISIVNKNLPNKNTNRININLNASSTLKIDVEINEHNNVNITIS